jgi:L,D-transpeptidase ErfK/SrfK
MKNMKTLIGSLLGIGVLVTCPVTCSALTFVTPPDGNVIGNIQYATVQVGESVADVAMRYNMGGYEMLEANPGVNYSHPKPGTRLVVPSRFILPDGPKQGIVINLSEMRLYFYHPDGVHISTYPVGVGQEGWNTPLGKTSITRMRERPTWIVPDSIMENYIANGKHVEKVNPPGPTNPLGDFAMNTGFTSIVIHGTPYPKAVGVRSSHGCIRMTNQDVGELFRMVKVGTPVEIIHQPAKIGREKDRLFLESHVPISQELYNSDYRDIGSLINKLTDKIGKRYSVQWAEVERVRVNANGYPLPIGKIF